MKLQIAVDRGGTFCDIWARIPGQGETVFKILSEDPANYSDAPAEGIRLVLEKYTGKSIPRGAKLDGSVIEWIRMGTTVATNALLERKGERFALVTTQGMEDALELGTQKRPELFNLKVAHPETLFDKVVEVEERVTVESSSDDPLDEPHLEDPSVVNSASGTPIRILTPLNEEMTRTQMKQLHDEGYRSVAICLLHSYLYDAHEQTVARLAREAGIPYVSLSSEVSKTINYVERGNATCVDAYLTPKVQQYVASFVSAFSQVPKIQFMQSDGGLTDAKLFRGINAIFSGPAGGVVGVSSTCFLDRTPLIGFDMGGTSTDVSRIDRSSSLLDVSYSNHVAGLDIAAPQLRIHTVAAGGGSILKWQGGLFHVGPESAGSDPGPTCYRKNGPLTVTDANLFLGRLVVSEFPHIFGKSASEPLDEETTRSSFEKLASQVSLDLHRSFSAHEVALGFLRVANVKMANSIRDITETRGFNAKDHTMVSFGGAGSQNCTAVARNLGIQRVVIHRYSSVLSAYGIAKAKVSKQLKSPFVQTCDDGTVSSASSLVKQLKKKIIAEFVVQGLSSDQISFKTLYGLKYKSSNTIFDIPEESNDLKQAFLDVHKNEFGFLLPETTPVLVQAVSVIGTSNADTETAATELSKEFVSGHSPFTYQDVYFEAEKPETTPVYHLESLCLGCVIAGPALLVDKTQTIVVDPASRATVLESHVVLDLDETKASEVQQNLTDLASADPIALTVFGHRFMGIAETMGVTLQRTSVSVSIKERLDFSCAIFSPDGGLVANAPHIPVHLGSMQYTIQYQHQLWKGKLKKGDVLVSNHPEAGGTHLPDLTVITPVFQDGEIVFYVASRGHHADIGGSGITAMSPNSKRLWEEGVSIKGFKLVSDGKFDVEGIRELFMKVGTYPGCSATRKFSENISDLRAQVSANQKGIQLVESLFKENGKEVVQYYMKAIRYNAEHVIREFFKKQYAKLGEKPIHAIDWFDDGTPVELTLSFTKEGEAYFDFTGTGPESYGPMNTPPSITYSCVIYTIRCLVQMNLPLNQGCLAPCHIKIPKYSILNPSGEAAICGSTIAAQRVTDVILKCFQVSAACQGDANSFGWGRGGKNPYTGKTTPGFVYGEALGGGIGALEGYDGASARKVHMTNGRTTDVEVVEARTPVIISKWCIRKGSGGKGKWHGGDGCIREIEARIPLRVSILSERRIYHPYGIKGGLPGQTGVNYWFRRQPDGTFIKTRIAGKEILTVGAGDRVQINTPGGGGYGKPEELEK